MDTTLRDGEQTQGVSFSPEEKTNIAKALLELVRVDRIEVASARVSAGELSAVSNIIDWARVEGLDGRVEVLGFVDRGKSVDWISKAGGRVINLLAKLIPRGIWLHDAQDGNGDSHLKAGLVGPSETVPVINGKLGLSTWQNLFLCEFDGPRRERKIVCTVLADETG